MVQPTDFLPLDPYIRVSRIGGRHGESLISPTDQLEKIEGCLVSQGLTVGERLKDLDYSGANVARPEFQRGLERIKNGESGGMVVVKLDRFARSVADAILTVREIEQHGGRFISVSEQIDFGSPSGRLQFHMIAAFAEFELARVRDSWKTAVERAVNRGVHVAAYAPLGYDRGADGRLSPNDDAPIVRELFERRSRGESWGKLCEWLDSTGSRPAPRRMRADDGSDELVERPWSNWTRQSAQGIVKNRVYLGEVRAYGGDKEKAKQKGKTALAAIVKEDSHPALVDNALFASANKTASTRTPRDGSIADQALATGFVRCKACGHTMVVTGRTYTSGPRKGTRVHVYYCRGRYSTGICDAAPAVDGPRLDDFVDGYFWDRVRGKLPSANPVLMRADLQAAEAQKLDAEQELAAFYAAAAPRTDAARKLHAVRQEELETAYENAADAYQLQLSRTDLIEGLESGDLAQAWPTLDIPTKRRLLRAAIEKVEIAPSNGLRGHRAIAIEKRASVIWR